MEGFTLHSRWIPGLVAVIVGAAGCSGGDGGVTNPPPPPTVASVTISPALADLAIGQAAELTATTLDADGNTLSGHPVTWSSSNNSVAIVSSTGLVTGLGEGSASITASSEGRSGSAQVQVSSDLIPSADFQIQGAHSFGSVDIPTGVTVTLTGDLVLVAEDSVHVAGRIIGDCVDLDVTAGAELVVAGGTVDTGCGVLPEDDAPRLRLVGEGGFSLVGASVTSSGEILITDDPAAPFGLPPNLASGQGLPTSGPPVAEASSAMSGSQRQVAIKKTCRVLDTHIVFFGSAPDGKDLEPTGEPGKPGLTLSIKCEDDSLQLGDGSLIETEGGGNGGTGTHRGAGPTTAKGGNGGHGGDIFLSASFDIEVSGTLTLKTGDGGNAGNAIAVSEPADDPPPSATAEVNGAGSGGSVFLITNSDDGTVFGDGEILVTLGDGGEPGLASALAADGMDATDQKSAQEGGNATAKAAIPMFGGGPGRRLLFVPD